MNRKIAHIINGSLAIYFGMGSLVPAIGGILGIGYELYPFLTGQGDIRWWLIMLLFGISAVSGLIAYILLRVGKEEIKEMQS